MSSAIRDVEKLNQRQLETVRKRNERELKVMDNAHQDYRTELKKTHEQELIDIQHAHRGHVTSEAEKKEKILTEMRSHLQKTKDLTEKELKALEEHSHKETAQIQQKFLINRERIGADNELYLEDLNHRFNEASQKVAYDGKNRVESVKSTMGDKYRETEEYYQGKLQKQTTDFNGRLNTDERTFRKLKDSQESQFKKDRLATNARQQTELSKMTQTHVHHIEAQDQNYRKGLKDQDLSFEKKFENQLGRHSSEFLALEEKNKKVIDGLKASLTQEITRTANRKDDPFYQMETLRPRLKEFEDRVEIQVEIPEHSKQDVQLTIHGKEAILSFNRRYNDAVKLPDGTINKLNKVESFTTRVPTSHILDAKSINSSYDEGVMNYVIKKA